MVKFQSADFWTFNFYLVTISCLLNNKLILSGYNQLTSEHSTFVWWRSVDCWTNKLCSNSLKVHPNSSYSASQDLCLQSFLQHLRVGLQCSPHRSDGQSCYDLFLVYVLEVILQLIWICLCVANLYRAIYKWAIIEISETINLKEKKKLVIQHRQYFKVWGYFCSLSFLFYFKIILYKKGLWLKNFTNTITHYKNNKHHKFSLQYFTTSRKKSVINVKLKYCM